MINCSSTFTLRNYVIGLVSKLVFSHRSSTVHDYSFSKKKEKLFSIKYIISEEFILKKCMKHHEINGNLHMFHTWLVLNQF